MAIMWTATLVVLLAIATALEARPVLPAEYLRSVTDDGFASSSKTPSIFDKGGHQITTIKVKSSSSYHPPKDLLIISPKETGNYPVFFFVHGIATPNYFYSQVFEQIASHGYIVVAPQLYLALPPFQTDEIESAVSVANWLATNLETALPEGVEGDFSKFIVSGHSRGGKTAFALALGKHKAQLNLNITVLITADPVAGVGKHIRTSPHILTFEPNSIDLSIPVVIIGTGLGNHSLIPLGPSCAPNNVNHAEFYRECRRATHFVLTDYGANDLLNDGIAFDLPYGPPLRTACVNGKGNIDPMRRTLAGIITGFLKYYYIEAGAAEYIKILAGTSAAPGKIFPVERKA